MICTRAWRIVYIVSRSARTSAFRAAWSIRCRVTSFKADCGKLESNVNNAPVFTSSNNLVSVDPKMASDHQRLQIPVLLTQQPRQFHDFGGAQKP
jgi:hypothetical protein